MREQKFKEAKVLFKTSNAILLNWATGVGKTLASLRLIDKNKKIIVLCQELNHIENWKKELKKHKLEFDIEFYTYASMHKIEYKNFDLILDEVHWCVSDLRLKRLSNLKYDRLIMLSASMEESDLIKIKEVVPSLKVHSVNLQTAIDAKVLPNPKVIIVEYELDNKIKQCVHFKNKGSNGKIYTCTYGSYYKTLLLAKKEKNYRLVCACTEYQKNKILESEGAFLKKQAFRNQKLWKVYNFKMLEIKRFLAHCKTQRAQDFVESLRIASKRFIVFSSSIEQSNQLSTRSVHSKSKENQRYIDEFNNKTVNELYTVKMLRESINLVDIQCGLIIQIDNKERSPVQMIGRILRGVNPEVFLMVFVNTKDDYYIRKNLKEINHVRKSFKQV